MLGLKTLPDDQENERWYESIQIGYAWIAGFQPYNFWFNTTNCFDRLTNFTYHELPVWQVAMNDETLTDYQRIETTLALVSNASVHGWYCNDMW